MFTPKAELRARIWTLLEREGVVRFPGAEGRIPNFAGAEKAAARLQALDDWRNARTIKANPDSPQRAVRELALREGKKVYMAVPRLRKVKCFVELDPARLVGRYRQASTIKGAFRWGRPILLEEMEPIDLIVAGSVAVTREGARVGKGGGYS
ncbi:MAG: 5-formyltetrahydrofolate cyclo-ligase, partial [Anaerolineae bacterium]